MVKIETDKIIKTNNVKKIFGRKVPIIEIEIIKKEIKTFGKSGGYITIPNKYIGAEAELKILGLFPFVCRDCFDTFTREKHYSPDKTLCRMCYAENQAIEKNKCLGCGGENPTKEHWGLCEECFGSDIEFNYELDEDKIENKNQIKKRETKKKK